MANKMNFNLRFVSNCCVGTFRWVFGVVVVVFAVDFVVIIFAVVVVAVVLMTKNGHFCSLYRNIIKITNKFVYLMVPGILPLRLRVQQRPASNISLVWLLLVVTFWPAIKIFFNKFMYFYSVWLIGSSEKR